MALVRRIIDLSLVDGPGNRTAVFLQGCNIHCAYCHNPETQALKDAEATEMSAEEVCEKILRNVPFIRGITVSGGECMLQPQWLEQLFRAVKAHGLSTLIDTNGTIDFSRFPSLLECTDGVMLDVKSWDAEVFRKLTGADNAIVKKNLRFLAECGKLEEVRIVCLPDGNEYASVDAHAVIDGIAETVGEHKAEFKLVLIRFRHNGVIGPLSDAPSPSSGQMASLIEHAKSLGFNVIDK